MARLKELGFTGLDGPEEKKVESERQFTAVRGDKEAEKIMTDDKKYKEG